MPRAILLLALLPLVALPGATLANPVPVPTPTWLAVPPFVLPYQPVFPALWNTSDEDIQVSDTWPWSIVHFEGDTEVEDFNPTGQPWAVVYPPGTGATWIWGGTTNEGTPPPPGPYFAKNEWWWTSEPSDVHVEYAPIQILDALNWHVEFVWDEELLMLFLRNDSSCESFELYDDHPWQILDMNGQLVYQPPPSSNLITLDPGMTYTDSWDLQLPGRAPLDPGEYVVQIELYDVGGIRSLLEDQFSRLPDPPGAVVWAVEPIVNSTRSAVALTLTNASADMIWLPNYGPWYIEDDEGSLVYTPISAQAIVPMPPGATYAWSWTEQDDAGAWVPAGGYVATIDYYTEDPSLGGPTRDQLFFPFTLVEPAIQPGCVFLETDNYQYEPEELVHFDFTNCTPATIGMHSIHTWWVATASGIPVYAPIVLCAREQFDPGEGFGADWDQTNSFDGEFVPEGSYIICATFCDELFLTNYVVTSAPFLILRPTGTEDVPAADLRLAQNYPNPFNPKTQLSFSLHRAELVEMQIYDATGQRVRTLLDGVLKTAGEHDLSWDGCDDAGRALPGGVYLVRVATPTAMASTKVVLIK